MRWAGVFAHNSPYRKEITLKPKIKKAFQFKDDEDKEERSVKNYSWSKMLAKVFKIDVTKCEKCGGAMKAIASVMDRDSVVRHLRHVGMDTRWQS